MGNYLRLLFGLLWQPARSIRELRASAPFAAAAVTAWLSTIIYRLAFIPFSELAQGRRRGFGAGARGVHWFTEVFAGAQMGVLVVLFLSLIYVPALILLGGIFARRRLGQTLREEFSSVGACVLSAYSIALLAAILPTAIISWQSANLPVEALEAYFALMLLIPVPIFAGIAALAIGAALRLGWISALVATLISLFSLTALPVLSQVFNLMCASPFLLLLLFLLLRGPLSELFDAQRSRHAFQQSLQAATLNPADASAHYNLALIYQQRGDIDAAEASFRRAIEIDDHETDAHYQLGRIARERGRLPESIAFFETVVKQAPTHSQHEIWREIARTYLAAGQYADALGMLDRFIDERQSDGEGRYWRGMALSGLGRATEAVEEMKKCIEAVQTSPAYKYRAEQEWMRRAEQFLRETAGRSG
ncbi:MAG: tetratricopeptide repeat protein [Acidobacteria bacterium]|nr:tetratricopeptide repeat protein [Acidobacteriota bacterium]